jgi:opacity protein-like surface antigen
LPGWVVLISLAVSLSGCFSGGKSTACYKPQEYHSSIEIEKLQVPDDLDPPNRETALVIAEGPRATEPVPRNQPCPEQPPDYFGLDSEVKVAAAPAAASAAAASASADAVSQGAFRDDRAGEWNLSLQAVYLGSKSSSGSNGSSINVQDDWGLGFMVGYNFTNHLALGFEMNFLEPRYDYTFVLDEPDSTPQTISEKLTMFNGLLTGTYNVLEGPVTPFVDLSLGLTNLDSNVADGPPTTGCWWDYWWGYVCRSWWSTYSDTSFSYGGALGIRWDINSAIFLRASYNLLRIDTGSSSSDPTLDMGRIEIGWRR